MKPNTQPFVTCLRMLLSIRPMQLSQLRSRNDCPANAHPAKRWLRIRRIQFLSAAIVLTTCVTYDTAEAQRRPGSKSEMQGRPSSGTRGGARGGPRNGPPSPQSDPDSTVSPVAVGQPAVAWYSTWETAQREAIRSNRPILYMAATTQCGGVPGVF